MVFVSTGYINHMIIAGAVGAIAIWTAVILILALIGLLALIRKIL